MNRREFLVQAGAGTAGCLTAGLLAGCLNSSTAPAPGSGRAVAIVVDPADPVASAPPAQWAVTQLREALAGRGFAVRLCSRLEETAPAELCVVAAGGSSALPRAAGIASPDGREALVLAPATLGERVVLLACGSDARGLVYALTEIADAVALLDDPQQALRPVTAVRERPANGIRSVMRLFVSDIEDKPWFNDRGFWRDYLSLLAAQRFNRFNLALGLGYDSPEHLRDTYFYFAVSVPAGGARVRRARDEPVRRRARS